MLPPCSCCLCVGSEDDPQLGLYGSFGYDLTFQFEPIRLKQDRSDEQRDVVLYVPDRILVVDQVSQVTHITRLRAMD